jgi:hypothetical protein
LLKKNGIKSFLNGENHLVWQDGEPIDPFVFAVLTDVHSNRNDTTYSNLLFQREAFNEGISFLEMSPMQRLLSARQPFGLDKIQNIPEWAKNNLSYRLRDLLNSKNHPHSYLIDRSKALAEALLDQVRSLDKSQQAVDSVISLAERLIQD